MKRSLIVIFLLISLMGCESNEVKYNKLSLSKYGINDSNVSINELNYEEFKELESGSNINGIVIIIRDDCQYCPVFMDNLVACIKEKGLENIYAIQSNTMSEDEKIEVMKKYNITSVPSMIIYKKGSINSIEIGDPGKEKLDEIISNFLK